MLVKNLGVSVVITTWNRPELVLRALQSVADQRRPPEEVIIVDNGSQRARISASDVRVIRAPVNLGVSQARNIGVALAHHEFIAFLDDDDAWDPCYLQEITKVIANRGGADCLVGALHGLGNGIALAGKQEHVASDSRRLIRRNPGFVGSNIVIHRELLLNLGGFDTQLVASEDIDLAIRLRTFGAVIERVESAVVRFNDEPARVRLSGERLLLRGKWQLVRKHVSNPVLRPLYWLEYAVRLFLSARFV